VSTAFVHVSFAEMDCILHAGSCVTHVNESCHACSSVESHISMFSVTRRIFSGACRPLSSGVAEKLGYHDFIWLLLSEEDKTSDTAINYWFRAIDLDDDGYITPYEMEFFYKEQLHRMDCLAQEVVQFEDILCQMTDMVKPAREGYVTVLDLKSCKQAGVFFNVLFNLTKFIQYDQKDPTQVCGSCTCGCWCVGGWMCRLIRVCV